MRTEDFAKWTRRFEDERERRRAQGDPDWGQGATLHPAVWAGVQRFQVGEDGDGANLVGKADQAGDADYAQAVRLFVAEEQNHARLLARLLAAGGVPTLTGHWSDAVFVRLRRLMGLRMELLVLMIAEVVALRYYRALRDGTDDPLTVEVAGRILSDEQRHVPFHCERLHASLAELPRATRRPVMALWRLLLLAVTLVVAADHGPALARLDIGRLRFVADVMASSHAVVSAVLVPSPDAWMSAG
ncbi:ferritin-like domain-containing protein [Streptomyces sp. NPDC059466]|uniref:ferritin-like domain-containing protein n=1 Tax=unclassified Streptomyces TaxID=2593676 RepID=UPI0036AA79CD